MLRGSYSDCCVIERLYSSLFGDIADKATLDRAGLRDRLFIEQEL